MNGRISILIPEEENLTWVQQFQEYYEKYDIYRTVVVFNNYTIMNYMCSLLEKTDSDYTVYQIREGADVPASIQEFTNSGKRILFLTVHDFVHHQEDVCAYLMNEHNLIVLENLRGDQENYAIQVIHNAFALDIVEAERYYIWLNK